jgi:hypothetical protein
LAKRTKKRQTKAAADPIEAEIISETPAIDDVDAAPVENAHTEPMVAEAREIDSVPEQAEQPKEPETPSPTEDVVQAPAPDPSASRENNVLLPMILGGIIAGGFGYGAAYLTRPVPDIPLDQQVAAHDIQITTLQTALEQTAQSDSVSTLSDQVGSGQAELNSLITALTARLSMLEERMNTLEKQPSSDGTLQETAIAAFQRELDTLRAQSEQMTQDAAAALQATREEAAAIEQNAVANARAAIARAAIARLEGAIASGSGFGDVLIELQDAIDTPLPAALTDVVEGVPTLGQLQADFPTAARAALATARAEGVSGEGEAGGGFGAFLRSQLNVRSVQAQDGDSVDAILSRAEASLRAGQLNATLAETATLPEVVRGTLAPWLAKAEMRADALAAVNDLSDTVFAK